MRHRFLVGFDGVLHSYTSGWQGIENIQDPPIEGAIEWLNQLALTFEVVICSTRASTDAGVAAIRRWLGIHGYVEAETIVITDRKLPAICLIDDRAFHFQGMFPESGPILDKYARKDV